MNPLQINDERKLVQEQSEQDQTQNEQLMLSIAPGVPCGRQITFLANKFELFTQCI
jgi:hypothetical protein